MLSYADKMLVENLWKCKRVPVRRLIEEFQTRNWKEENSAKVANYCFDRTYCIAESGRPW